MNSLCERASKLGISLSYSSEAVENLSSSGFDKNYGARPLRREITAQVEDLLSQKLLEGEIKKGDIIMLNVEDGKYILSQTVEQY